MTPEDWKHEQLEREAIKVEAGIPEDQAKAEARAETVERYRQHTKEEQCCEE